METTINYLPKNWDKNNFANWYVNHIKANHILTEDYNLIRIMKKEFELKASGYSFIGIVILIIIAIIFN